MNRSNWMLTKLGLGAALLALCAATAQAQTHAQTRATAQDANAPLSAIDWLSDSLATPVALPLPAAPSADIATSALPEDVSVTPLGGPRADAVGLRPAAELGLPATLWGRSSSADIASRITAMGGDMLPATRELFQQLLVAELDPPFDSTPQAPLFLARVDALLAQGLLAQADGLMQRAGPATPEIFRRWFDTSLLNGTEDRACATLRDTPDLSPTFPARIFCLARSGDWDAAALTLETAKALGILSPRDDALLAAFLHAELAEEGEIPAPPTRPSPLEFRLYEAIGEPLPTTTLPLAFARADLRDTAGWKAQLEAAERLARVGALAPDALRAIYLDRLPAASGGIWDRIDAFQKVDIAIRQRDAGAVATQLPRVWAQMEAAELEVPFATLYGARLAGLPLAGDTGALAFHIGLLGPEYETIANNYPDPAPDAQFLIGIARGNLQDANPATDYARAIAEGFAATAPPVRLQSLLSEDRLGEAILRAMALLTSGAQGDLDEISDAFAFLRTAGLEDVARRAALQLLLLERRG